MADPVRFAVHRHDATTLTRFLGFAGQPWAAFLILSAALMVLLLCCGLSRPATRRPARRSTSALHPRRPPHRLYDVASDQAGSAPGGHVLRGPPRQGSAHRHPSHVMQPTFERPHLRTVRSAPCQAAAQRHLETAARRAGNPRRFPPEEIYVVAAGVGRSGQCAAQSRLVAVLGQGVGTPRTDLFADSRYPVVDCPAYDAGCLCGNFSLR